MLPIRIPTPARVKQRPATVRSRCEAGAGAGGVDAVVGMSKGWVLAVISTASLVNTRSTPAYDGSPVPIARPGSNVTIGRGPLSGVAASSTQPRAGSSTHSSNCCDLLYRHEEREMSPLCVDQGIGVIPWSPMARGRLTRDPETTTARSETDEFGKTSAAAAVEADGAVIERVAA